MNSYKDLDLTGRRFGKLTVQEKSNKGRSRWICKCDCGNTREFVAYRLMDGHNVSCGCYVSEMKLKHGGHQTRIYNIYGNMKRRCYSKGNTSYNNYGGRGIKVCDEWLQSFEAFRDWAFENGYSDDLSIDRIDVNGNYEPDNCRWVDGYVQGNNKRYTKRYAYKGEQLTIGEFSRKTGISVDYISSRIKRVINKRGLEEIEKEWVFEHNIPSNMMRVNEYAEKNNLTETIVRHRLSRNILNGIKVGNRWYVCV